MSRDAVWRATDDLFLLYHRPSGETHVLAPDLFAILTAIDATPSTPAEVVARLTAQHELETEGDAPIAVVSARLAELAELGLADVAR